jgi:uncharacterized protein YndB with AHSA1/START domain
MGQLAIEIEGSADRVWDALTSREALRDWFNPTTEIEPRQGGRVSFEGARGDQTYHFEGSVTAIEPAKRIAVDLRSSTGDDVTLAITLRPGPDFTTVELHHDGFDETTGDAAPFWDGDELIALREHVAGIGPTH